MHADLKQAWASTETVAALLQRIVRRASSLRDALKTVDAERAELLAALRQLEGVYRADEAESKGTLRTLCASVEDVNRVFALEQFHLTSTLIDPLQALVEQPVVVQKSYKNMAKVVCARAPRVVLGDFLRSNAFWRPDARCTRGAG